MRRVSPCTAKGTANEPPGQEQPFHDIVRDRTASAMSQTDDWARSRLGQAGSRVDAAPLGSVYAAALLAEAPRVLSLMDREAMSPTSGCGDRTYWAWKFVDFPATRLQESVCALAFLYATPLPASPFYRSVRLLQWIDHALQFWSGIQHRDGSFDEAYPFERSLAATAFTSFYVGEALEMVGGDLPASTLATTKATLARAGHWLTGNDETHGFLSNHLAAAAGALFHIARQTGEAKCERRSWYFLDRILQRQSSEGWYDEYGGADPGYQTHGSFYLARCWQLSQDERLAESLARSTRFLAHFIHPDRSIGGEYTSRNTQTYYPAAFEMLSDRDPTAAWIAHAMRPSLESGAAASLRCIDIFNYFPFLNNFVFAHRAFVARPGASTAPADPTVAFGLTWFPEAGLARMRSTGYDAYVGTAKGSVVKVFDRTSGKLTYSDCGYLGRLHSGALVSSQYHDSDRPTRAESTSLEIEGDLVEFSRPTMSPPMFIAFRLFTLTVGRLPGLARWVKARLVKTLIYRRRPVKVRFRRRVDFLETGVRIRDWLSGPDGARLHDLRREGNFTTIHMGSSRYFILNELTELPLADAIDPAAIVDGVEMDRTAVVAG